MKFEIGMPTSFGMFVTMNSFHASIYYRNAARLIMHKGRQALWEGKGNTVYTLFIPTMSFGHSAKQAVFAIGRPMLSL